MLPYKITIQVMLMKRKLNEKELLEAEVASDLAWEVPNLKIAPLLMNTHIGECIDQKVSLTCLKYEVDKHACLTTAWFDDVDPNNIMLYLGEIAKACGSKQVKQGVMMPEAFCKKFHCILSTQVEGKEDRHTIYDMYAPDGKTHLRCEYRTLKEAMAARKPENTNIEDFFWWWKKQQGEPEEDNDGFMTAEDFFGTSEKEN